MLAIESTGGKEICDTALLSGDLPRMVFGLGVLAPRDMKFLPHKEAVVKNAGPAPEIKVARTADGRWIHRNFLAAK